MGYSSSRSERRNTNIPVGGSPRPMNTLNQSTATTNGWATKSRWLRGKVTSVPLAHNDILQHHAWWATATARVASRAVSRRTAIIGSFPLSVLLLLNIKKSHQNHQRKLPIKSNWSNFFIELRIVYCFLFLAISLVWSCSAFSYLVRLAAIALSPLHSRCMFSVICDYGNCFIPGMSLGRTSTDPVLDVVE